MISVISELSSEELRDYATVVTALVALSVFIVNSILARRNRRIENLTRFFDVHRRLFDKDGYLLNHLSQLAAQTISRPHKDEKEEASFHAMMLEIERLAILAKNRAVPEKTQVYMFGVYAQKLLHTVTAAERENTFWELGVAYLHRLANLAGGYEALPIEERADIQKGHT